MTDWWGLDEDVPGPTWFRFGLANSALAGEPGGGLLAWLGGVNIDETAFSLAPDNVLFKPDYVLDAGNAPPWLGNVLTDNALDWSLRYDASNGYMELNHTWFCDDKTSDRCVHAFSFPFLSLYLCLYHIFRSRQYSYVITAGDRI